MLFEDYYSLEFCGGPYDGYSQQVTIPHGNLLEMVSLPVNQNVLRVIQGDPPGPEAPTKSVAVYELRETEGQWRYYYTGSCHAGDLDWDQWCLKVCEAWKKFHHETSASQEFERDS